MLIDWRPIESAPRDGTQVLLYCVEGDGTVMMCVGEYDGPYGPGWKSSIEAHHLNATHWLPLPLLDERGHPPGTFFYEQARLHRAWVRFLKRVRIALIKACRIPR